MWRMELTRTFGELGKSDALIAGGKGASLGEMTRAGISVPPGFVVLAPTFDRFLTETDLVQEIAAVLGTVKHDEMHTVEHASEKIQGLILAATMPGDIATAILSEHAKLGGEFVAVRSSATAEDGAEHAWAGQLDTHLNTPKDEVLRNVQRCWASLFTPRAIFYRFEKGLHGTAISVAVVVQKMVQSEISGIAFSVHPVTEDRNQLIIEAGFGLGEAIVSGQVTPDSYVVEKQPRRIIDVNVSEQSRGLYKKAGGGNEWQDLGEKGKAQVLTEAQILELSELIIHIENHYGFPCDIEWAYEGGKFYITQSRPITTLGHGAEHDANSSLARLRVYVEDYDVPFSPWYILNERGFLFDLPEMSDGRLSLDSALLFEKDFVIWAADPDQLTAACEYFMAKAESDESFRNSILTGHESSLKEVEQYVGTILKPADLASLDDAGLFAIYRDTYQLFADVWKWGLIIQYADMGHIKYSDKVRHELADLMAASDEGDALFASLIATTKETYVGREIMAVWKTIARIKGDPSQKDLFEKAQAFEDVPDSVREELQALADAYGFLQYYYIGPSAAAAYYFDLLKRQWSADPASAIAAKEADTAQVLALQARYESSLSPLQKLQVGLLREFGYYKELRKEVQIYLLNAAMHRWYEEVGRRLGCTAMQARYVRKDEYESMLVRGEKRLTAAELERRYEACATVLIDGKLEFLVGEDARRTKDLFLKESVASAEATAELKGMIAFKGRATGRVKIVNSVRDMAKVEEGDVMVSYSTNPSLVPAMNKAAAIVTNAGGVTCHAAIVSRELRIPCIIGAKDATKILKDGDLVEVDAEKGVVRILGK